MQCPYCVSAVPEQALACPNCARDLYLFRPLLQGIAALEAQLTGQKEQIVSLENRLAVMEQRPAAQPSAAAAAAAVSATETAPASQDAATGSVHAGVLIHDTGPPAGADGARNAVREAQPLGAFLACVVLPLALLLLAHWILLFIYDVKPLYLRLTTLVLPIPFGIALALRFGVRLGPAVAVATAVGLCAVAGMLGLTGVIDKVPFLPSSTRDWRETIEYVGGIGGAFFTGCLIAHAIAVARNAQPRTPPRIIVLAVKAFKPNDKGEMGVEVLAKRIQRLVNAATPAVTGAAAFYAGIQGVIGGA